MDDPAASTTIRPLARSLDPLTGESLGGYLLRLACRLHLTPIKLARRTGCAGTQLSRRLLLDLDVAGFARAARLTFDQTAALTLVPWADRYPPIARSQDIARPTRVDSWLFSDAPRYCPQCLAGDGSPIQLQYGGPWKKIWHLPISFACTGHRVFLRQDCPRTHPPQPETWRLIARPADSTLHPAQCRQDDCTEGRKGKGSSLRRPRGPDPRDRAPPPGLKRPGNTAATARRSQPAPSCRRRRPVLHRPPSDHRAAPRVMASRPGPGRYLHDRRGHRTPSLARRRRPANSRHTASRSHRHRGPANGSHRAP